MIRTRDQQVKIVAFDSNGWHFIIADLPVIEYHVEINFDNGFKES